MSEIRLTRRGRVTAQVIIAVTFLAMLGFAGWIEGM